jgi:hypothetical protein
MKSMSVLYESDVCAAGTEAGVYGATGGAESRANLTAGGATSRIGGLFRV